MQVTQLQVVRVSHVPTPPRDGRLPCLAPQVRLCTPGEAPRRGKGGTLASRQALLHSAVHIENWAVDLSWDVIARWGLRRSEYRLPRAFFDDFVRVGCWSYTQHLSSRPTARIGLAEQG